MTDSNSVPSPTIDPPIANPSMPTYRLPPGSCDSHAHVFGPARQYPYVTDRAYTPHDVLLDDYVRLLKQLGFERAVLVQPSVYGTDNRLLADALADAVSRPQGIEFRGIAVLNADVSDAQLQALAALGVCGVRLNLAYVDGGYAESFARTRRLVERIAPLGWHLQIMTDITVFHDLAELLATLPVDSVIDHIGYFPAQLGPRTAPFQALKALMQEGRTWMKLCGPNRISSSPVAPFDDVRALVQDLARDLPDHLVFGTDWPHTKLDTPVPDDGVLVDELFRWLDGDRALARRILVDNPARLYGFGGASLARHHEHECRKPHGGLVPPLLELGGAPGLHSHDLRREG